MLENKIVLVTGSSRGIGAAIAKIAKGYRAQLIVHGKEPSPELEALAKELGARTTSFDVSDEKAVQAELAKLGNIDVLVNNAGINPSKTFSELTDMDWRQIFDVNVFGLANVSRAVLAGMVARKSGTIVNIASIKGFNSVQGKPAYAASKAAVIRMTSSMAEEFAQHGIRINAVAPGFTETEMTAATLSPKIQSQIDSIPLKRMARPEEIAEMVAFLSSDKAAYITGQTFPVDGGYSIAG